MMATLEDRAGDRLGQHVRHQAGRGHPGLGDASRPARGRGRLPARRAQRPQRLRRARPVSALTEDPRVDRVTFTGEFGTGKIIMASAATHLAPVSLELGGKGANIVFDDADLDNAVHWAVEAIFRNAGQVCLAGSRLFVQSALYDEFLDRFVAAAEALTFGDPIDPATQFSSLGQPRSTSRRSSATSRAPRRSAATILTGGRGRRRLVGRAADDRRRPAAGRRAVLRGDLRPGRASSTPSTPRTRSSASPTTRRYGLNAMVFTENLSRAHRVASRLRAGTVWVNCFFIRDLRTPFGGVGDSGVGREGGTFSREFFTEPKAVVMQIDRG